MAATTGPVSKACSWKWYSNTGITRIEVAGGKKARSRIQAQSGQVVIDQSDGLPVELMEFSVGEQLD